MDDKKPPRRKPVFEHNNDGSLKDPDSAKKVTDELMKKFLTEQRLHEKENSFNIARSSKRDVVVHLAVTVLPSVDGHTVIGEQEREYNQWCFKISAKELPIRNGSVIKRFAELCHTGKQALLSLGMVRE